MKPEYNLSKMQKRPNPFAQNLKQQIKRQITIPLRVDVIEYFEHKAQEQGISSEELISLYLQDCMVNKRQLSCQ